MLKTIQWIMAFLCIFASPGFAADSLRFATHARSPLSDYLREILTVAFEPMGIGIAVEEMSGDRVIQMVNEGKADGDPSRIRRFRSVSNEAADNYRLVDAPIVHVKLVMVTHKDTPVDAPSWESANRGNVLFVRGSKRIRKNVAPENRNEVEQVEKALELLSNDRFRSAVVFHSQAQLVFRDNPVLRDSLVLHEKPLESFNLYPYLNKKHAALIPRLEEALKKLRVDGTMARIAEKYFLAAPVDGMD
jgi:polar amino acid transport system substrate-binding protein